MNEGEEILRIAAKGDGVTASGRFAWGCAPGDILLPDGTLRRGPHHIDPACRHFGQCGGCQLQQLDEHSLAEFVERRVTNASTGQQLEVGRMAPAHLSPPATRRRASLRAESSGGRIVIGFREAKSHRVIELIECPVLIPQLAALLAPLRKLLIRVGRSGADSNARGRKAGSRHHAPRLAADVDLAMVEQGVDLGIKGIAVDGLTANQTMLDFAQEHALARLTLDQGYGAETLWEPDPVTVSLGGVSVGFPQGAFLQATQDGEQALVAATREWLAGATAAVDLFAGLGTFAFALAGPATKVLAVEGARDAHLACKAAAARSGRPLHALHRDLFRNPLQPEELNRFDAAVLDPPRAGAREQVGRLAESRVARIVYVSCNPSSWARDAAVLASGGYRLAEVRPVGQFRWSTHIELASLFVRTDC